ncbi:MAG TPA: SPOR domain-containing protein [Caldithrix abyssi]|uniref:SPOR domain-containing protein n=1 Tax=Caldithrix abyssi TaxID=187145 RepID=A0A7V5LJU3_CALAY|nr:SPOR domain-containing protein [Caldithrix abyssi]
MGTAKYIRNYLKYLLVLTIFAVSLALFSGCAAAKKQVTPASEETVDQPQAESQFDESFDPLSLDDDDIVIKRTHAMEGISNQPMESLTFQPANREQNTESIPDSLIIYQEADGFRVQIFAGRNVETATMTKTKALADFEPYKQKVYFIFEAPFYKIRIGDFTDRNKAEKARELARKLGYREAFVVKSKVRVPKDLQ